MRMLSVLAIVTLVSGLVVSPSRAQVSEPRWLLLSEANAPPIPPWGRYGSAMAYDAARGELVVFGGSRFSEVFNDTWVWDGFNWTRKFPATSPPAAVLARYDLRRGARAGGAVWGY